MRSNAIMRVMSTRGGLLVTSSDMPTIAEFAKTLGVSKTTVVNKIKDMGLSTVRDAKDGRGVQLLPAPTCSALADKLAKTKPAAEADEARLLALYQAQIEPLQTANASLQAQVGTLMEQVKAAELRANERVLAAQAQADALRAQVEQLEAANADLKRQLALAQALEGFHWPWERDRIKAKYLLPSGE